MLRFFRILSETFVARDLGRRDKAVDAFRGMAIIGMILVNHAPPTENIYAAFVHAQWIGWSTADVIFPAFLFLVGVSITLKPPTTEAGAQARFYSRMIRRTVFLLLINMVLVNLPYYEFEKFTVTGTLSRIAICYFAASILSRHLEKTVLLVIVGGILIIQWWFLSRFDVPDIGHGVFTPNGNASEYIDRTLFGTFADRLMLNGPVIQGLLPSAGAIASTLIGTITGTWLRLARSADLKVANLFAAGAILLVSGMMWGVSYPVSKQLWTGSYVIMMAGMALQLLAFTYWLTECRGLERITQPLEIAGVNAIFFYVFAQSLQRFLVYGRITVSDGSTIRYRQAIHETWVNVLGDGKSSSLLFVLLFLSTCYAAVYLLYRRRIFFKL